MSENKIAHQLQAAKASLGELFGSARARNTAREGEYRARGGFGRVEQKLRDVFKR